MKAPIKINLIEKWKNLLDSNFRVVEGKNQFQYLEQILPYKRGCAQMYTGYGKTELQLAVIESYMTMFPDKNVVVLVPDNTVKKEFIKRSEKYDLFIKPEYHKFEGRFQIINPIGIGKSKKYQARDPELVAYFQNVGLVVVDELHHITAATYLDLIYNWLTNYDYIYGFSGTIDSAEGYIPTWQDTPLDMSGRLNRIVGIVGLPRLVVKNPNPIMITYLRVNGTRVPEKLKFNYQKSIQIFFNSIDLIVKIVDFLVQNPDRRLFLPIIKREQGRALVDRVTKVLGEGSAVFLSSKGTYPNVTEMGYEDVKDYLTRHPNFRIIVGTSAMYEGFDSDRLNTIVLGIGKSQRMSIQPTGRTTRSEDVPMVLLPWCTRGNVIVNKQTRTRYESLKREFANYKFVSLG